MNWTPRRLKWLLNCYPPLRFAGVRVLHVSDDWRELHVEMKLRWYNRNAVGTHFGGSLYAMVDPHLMLMLMNILGRGYIVWDQAASIEFRKPGRGTVHAVVRVTDEMIEDIRQNTANGEAYRPAYEIDVLNDEGDVVAAVTKTLYFRRKADRRGGESTTRGS